MNMKSTDRRELVVEITNENLKMIKSAIIVEFADDVCYTFDSKKSMKTFELKKYQYINTTNNPDNKLGKFKSLIKLETSN